MNIRNEIKTGIFVGKSLFVRVLLQTEVAEQFHNTVHTIFFNVGCHMFFIVVKFRNRHRLCVDAKTGWLGVIGKFIIANVNPFRIMVVERTIYFQK